MISVSNSGGMTSSKGSGGSGGSSKKKSTNNDTSQSTNNPGAATPQSGGSPGVWQNPNNSDQKWVENTDANGNPNGKWTRFTYMDSSLNPNSPQNQPDYYQNYPMAGGGNQNQPGGNTEVNPQVRQQFEAQYGAGNTFGKDGKGYANYQDYTFQLNQSKNSFNDYIPIWGPLHKNIQWLSDPNYKAITPFTTILLNQGLLVGETAAAALGVYAAAGGFAAAGSEALGSASDLSGNAALLKATGETAGAGGDVIAKTAASRELLPGALTNMVKNILGKKLLSIGITKLAGAGVFVASTGFFANWGALDDVVMKSDGIIGGIVKSMGAATPAEREEFIKTAQLSYDCARIANAQIQTSMIINPEMWVWGQAWSAGSKNMLANMERNLNALKNYNPMNDYTSLETQQAKNTAQLQTYGKPKYDSQGNPLPK